ncbi:MAG: chemotaxis response regulator protein-glutamate methylesterase [Desulfovibrionaceae bacterium]|jgi:two-component system chemotaxis response regulator CheB|nr:chemotaxis response regulator protein-glutamate methylesterase [Desulfovibrionaceae bacterium]
MTAQRIKVLIVDDSALVRQTLQSVLESDSGIEVVGVATDPYVAAQRLESVVPDVITLDVEMPRMDGITFLRKLMAQHPIPVVICSTLTEQGAETTLKALEYGAVDIILKPKVGTKQFLEESRIRICDAVRAAAACNPKKLAAAPRMEVQPKLTADAVLAAPAARAMAETTEKMVVIGASTGGTEALREVLEALPRDCPPIAIVQHMPEKFTAAFSDRLNRMCAITVREARDNDSMLRGQALIAPGNRHMLLKRSGARYFVQVKDGPMVSRHRPSVDVLFRSAASYAGKNAVAVIMTGMGDDGAKGMRELHDAGAMNFAQDEKSCVVFGMPQEAIKLGGVDKVVPLSQIAREIVRAAN